jgi:protein-S-isoprenylcysteine O-methyltransferase Ste14
LNIKCNIVCSGISVQSDHWTPHQIDQCILLIIKIIGWSLSSGKWWSISAENAIGYIAFKKFIDHEYKEMIEVFGEEYKQYKERTPEFFPFFK